MNKRVEFSRGLLVAGALVVLLIGFVAGTRSKDIYALAAPLVGARVVTDRLDDESLQSTYQTLKENYNGTLSDQKLLEGAKRGLVEAAGDPYTVYMSAKDAEEFNKELHGEIGGGIGAEIGLRRDQPTVIRTLADNPAEEAGVHAGDIILAINDESVEGWGVDRTVSAIRGKPDTSLKLTVRRGSETKEISITRKVVNNPSVSSKMQGTTGIVTLTRFDEDTVALLRKTVDRLKSQGMKQMVLDMRGNGGGYLDAAPGVAGLWLDSNKEVVTIKGNHGGRQRMNAEGDPTLKGMKTAIIVNGGSASATEIVTAALKYHGAVTVVGEKTFGKGTVQEILPLSNGAQLKVTIKRWYTPAGDNVTDKKGIKPQVKAGLSQKDLDAGRDPQIQAAIKAVNG